MKPGKRPPASPPNDGQATLTAHWVATPCIKDRPHHEVRHIDLKRCSLNFEVDWKE
jgi:hypothetical protein